MANDIIITPASSSIQFSGSAVSSIVLKTEASGSLNFIGASGSLFSIEDNLSGSLMSVSDISGLPTFEVFSDDSVNIGKFNAYAIQVKTGGKDVSLGSGSVMFISSSGKVGIGTNSPVNKLDVVGNISCSVITASLFNGTASLANTASYVKNAQTASFADYATGASLATTALVANLATNADYATEAGFATNASVAGDLTSTNDYTVNILTATTKVNSPTFTNDNGQVTLAGVDLPDNSVDSPLDLTVKGGDSINSPVYGGNVVVHAGLGGYGYGNVQLNPYGGNVGMNNISPQFTLDVAGDINFTGDLYKNGVPFTIDTSSFATTGSNTFTGDQTISGSVVFFGYTTGSVDYTSLQLGTNQTKTNITNNCVLIGNGTAQNCKTGSNSIVIGKDACKNYTSPLNSMFVAGHEALSDVITGNDQSYTTYIGYQAGKYAQYSSWGTFIGFQANYTGSNYYGTSIGFQAGYGGTKGGGVGTFIGYMSGYNVTTNNSYVTAIGAETCYDTVNSSYGTYVGYQAGKLGRQTPNSTIIGAYAGSAIDSGSYSTLVGRGACSNTKLAVSTVAIGGQCATNAPTASYATLIGRDVFGSGGATNCSQSVMIGYRAGYNSTVALNNTFIGTFADRVNTNVSNSIAIGYNAKVSQSNQCVIGYTGSLAVNVGIGTINPLYTLDVSGSINGYGFVNGGISIKTTNYEITTSDYVLIFSGSSELSASLPSATTNVGRMYKIKNVSPYNLTITGSQNIDNSNNLIINQWSAAELISSGVKWYIT